MNIRRVVPFARFPLGKEVGSLWKNDWTCRACRRRASRSQFSTSRRLSEKPYYITTPIFYVNAAPHVGHFYTMVLTDILKRWQVLKGKKAILCTGTDEHGMKIQQAAAKAHTPPKEFCDLTAETFKTLAKKANLSNDHFVRTTDQDHKEAVEFFWQMLQEREYIYESKHQGWYCVSDETFYPESAIEKRLDPHTGQTFMASSETGKEVEWTSEKNYHFRLSAMKDDLLDFYKKNPKFVVPAARMNDVVKWVSEGLEDLSISRPVERLTWGIRVPDDDSQTIYVWLDALVNYITKAGYPWTPGQEQALGWPADVQVIGKDIVRFHCIYWPAFLLALGLQPPKQILTHAHWTLNHQKMAKSTGNAVNPFFAMDRFGTDVMRYYLAHDGGILNDADYDNRFIVERYRKGLQGALGNLVSRITRSKIWSVSKAVIAAHEGRLAAADGRAQDTGSELVSLDASSTKLDYEELIKAHTAMLERLGPNVDKQMAKLNVGAALKIIMEAVYHTNRLLTAIEPWTLAKKVWLMTDAVEKQDLDRRINLTVYHCAEALRITGILLQPYMPTKSAQLLDMLGVNPSRRNFKDAELGGDSDYGIPKVPLGNCAYDALFPPLAVET